MSETKWIVIYGDIVNGVSFRGPFDSEEKAFDYAELTGGEHYVTAELTPPNTEDDEEDNANV